MDMASGGWQCKCRENAEQVPRTLVTHPNSVDATIVGHHGQLQLRLPILFILFIFLLLFIAAL